MKQQIFRWRHGLAGATAALALACASAAPAQQIEPSVRVPEKVSGPKRLITTDDIARLRDIATLSISPDGKQFVILVRQADPDADTYRSAWFLGSMDGAPLRYVADGGEARLMRRMDGIDGGGLVGSPARWSPDGEWIAFAKQSNGELQVWRAKTDGTISEQVSHNAGDVRDYTWTSDGTGILFTADTSREERAATLKRRARSGTRLQEFALMSEAIHSGRVSVPLSPDPGVFAVKSDGSGEHAATEAEREAFKSTLAARTGGWGTATELTLGEVSAAFRPPVANNKGAGAWMERADQTKKGFMPPLRVVASLTGKEADAVRCTHAECTSPFILDLFWSGDGREIVFSATGGATLTGLTFYAWNPAVNTLRTIAHFPDGAVESCSPVGDRLICLREERLRPRHVFAIDVASGRTSVLADVNPEFQTLFKLGHIERLDWPTRKMDGGSNTPMVRGYVIYPPDYDPKISYPLFVAPYSNYGFARGDVGNEHPLLAYAAAGFVVLDSEFPHDFEMYAECADGQCTIARGYDEERGFPHLTTRAWSALDGIDAVAKRANIDLKRVGIGGVSNGTFVPLYMVQIADRLSALSVAGGSWSQEEYYVMPLQEPWADPSGFGTLWWKDPAKWAKIDLSHHIDTVEAPILFHFADRELYTGAKLVRNLTDARLPAEAYTFEREYHEKIWPAHRSAIYNRNLDWFRFWLMDIEDNDPAKAEQYGRWRKLRELQCRNPRALRGDYCASLPTEVRGTLPGSK